jgi:hypothetical protein
VQPFISCSRSSMCSFRYGQSTHLSQ